MTPGRRDDTPSASAGELMQANARGAGGLPLFRDARPPAARDRYQLAPHIGEAAFLEQVVQLARLGGWMTYHTHDSRRSQAGFPDCVFVHPGRGLLVFAELKAERGRVRSEQQQWLDALQAVRPQVRVHLWRPSQFDEIADLLLDREAG